MFEAVRAKGDKAFVRLVTNFGTRPPRSPRARATLCGPKSLTDRVLGNLNVELFCDKVPKTCYNFLKLASDDKYRLFPLCREASLTQVLPHRYKETIFHRLIPGFMVSTCIISSPVSPLNALPPTAPRR